MEVGTTPLRWKFLRGNQAEREDRFHRTNVAILDFPASGNQTCKRFTNADELETELLKTAKPGFVKTPVRLLIVEDLSRRIIEILGARFDIDPSFFREQIDDYSWYNIRDQWMDPPNLKASTRHRNWIRVRFVTARYFRTRDSYKKAREDSNRFNVFRRPDDDQNRWSYMDEGAVVGLTRTRSSIWIGKDSGPQPSAIC